MHYPRESTLPVTKRRIQCICIRNEDKYWAELQKDAVEEFLIRVGSINDETSDSESSSASDDSDF